MGKGQGFPLVLSYRSSSGDGLSQGHASTWGGRRELEFGPSIKFVRFARHVSPASFQKFGAGLGGDDAVDFLEGEAMLLGETMAVLKLRR